MKKLMFIFLSLTLITSCSKKDDSPDPEQPVNNGFNYNGHFYNTEKAGFVNWNDTIEIVLYSGTVSLNASEMVWEGTGHAVLFDEIVAGNTSNGMPVGNYNLSNYTQPGYFTMGVSRMNYNFTADTGFEVEALHGNVSITKINTSKFKINYTLTNNDSTTVTGEFTGVPLNMTNLFTKKSANYKLVKW